MIRYRPHAGTGGGGGLCLFKDAQSADNSSGSDGGAKNNGGEAAGALNGSSAVSRLVRTLAEWLVVLRGIAEEREADQPPVRCRCKKAENIHQELRHLGQQLKDAEQVKNNVLKSFRYRATSSVAEKGTIETVTFCLSGTRTVKIWNHKDKFLGNNTASIITLKRQDLFCFLWSRYGTGAGTGTVTCQKSGPES